ncbi:MAG: hypothetical protein LQ338_004983 [Usnochroma carphineum]|nr:MAG: hypothetical protein LQ338_004983 [Usnochroma carphineum]
MGIKGFGFPFLTRHSTLTYCRIYGQIGPGERIALSKLAVEHFEKHGRPMRIAIDASIWHFQTQFGQGGSNPALRTLYYRLVRLLSLSIRPLFVFDGPNKPPFKRNVKTGNLGAQLPNFIMKRVLDLFGFPYHTAPGEAEAECALLQKEGIVDAVLSEDVDTMMFGCTVHLRNWSSENVRGNKSPTHVNMYRAETTKSGKSGLDSEGMILIGLMSGGDYIPAGVPGCGIKIACEAARAGFGRDLCRIQSNDTVGFNQWRERLQYELRVNESGVFRTRHKALMIPEDFPDRKVLRYYTHPAVSTSQQMSRLSGDIKWDKPLDLPGLRHFVGEAFEWQNISGAKKFVRTLAPAMLVDQLCRRYDIPCGNDDLEAQELEESRLVTAVCGRRSHWVADAVPELRLIYTPIETVGLDLNAEQPDAAPTASSDSENEIEADDEEKRSRSPTKRAASRYDPTQPEKIWVLESYAKFGIPLAVENWEETMKDPKKFATRKVRERAALGKRTRKPELIKPGAMDAFVKTMKPGVDRSKSSKRSGMPIESLSSSMVAGGVSPNEGNPTEDHLAKAPQAIRLPAPSTPRRPISTKVSKPPIRKTPSSVDKAVNPWTLAKRPPDTLNAKLTPGTRFSALGIYGPSSDERSPQSEEKAHLNVLDNSEQLPTPSSSGSRRRRNSPDLSNGECLEDLTSRRVNRKLDFATPSVPTAQSRPTTPDSLPSPTALRPPPREEPLTEIIPNSPSPSRYGDVRKKASKRARALLALRESLDGAWRDIEPWEQDRTYIKTMYEQVEIVDLTRT